MASVHQRVKTKVSFAIRTRLQKNGTDFTAHEKYIGQATGFAKKRRSEERV
jgi:hypothetical protein